MFKIQACYMAMFPSHLISGFPFVSILLFGGLAMFQHIWTYEKHPGYDVRPVSVVHLHQLPASRSGRSFWRPSPHSQAAERSPAALSDSMVHRRRRGCRGRRSREASQAFRGMGADGSETDGLKKFSLGHGRLALSNDLSGKELCSRPQEAIEHHLLGGGRGHREAVKNPRNPLWWRGSSNAIIEDFQSVSPICLKGLPSKDIPQNPEVIF